MIFPRKLLFGLPLCLMFMLSQSSLPAFAGGEDLSSVSKTIDFSTVNAEALRKEADELFVKAFDSQPGESQNKFYKLSMQKYFLISQIYPADYYAHVQIARIHDNQKHDKLAKKYYSIAFNLDKYNPYSNFYYGEYHFKREMYYRALKYYLIAYNNGYKDNFVINLKLAELYQKLGDLKKSKEFYEKSYKLNPQASDLPQKIQELNSLNYEKSEYYHLIRE